jgi:hypothetical protein
MAKSPAAELWAGQQSALSLRRRDNTLLYFTFVRRRWTKMINTTTTSTALTI